MTMAMAMAMAMAIAIGGRDGQAIGTLNSDPPEPTVASSSPT